MANAGVAYIIRGSSNNIRGYVYESNIDRKFVYIPQHKVGKYRKLLNNCIAVDLPPCTGLGINQTLLNHRVGLSGDLSKLAWYLLNNWVNPTIVYSTLGMTQAQVEGLEYGAEAFILPTEKYIGLAKRLVDTVLKQDGRFNIALVANELGINKMLPYIR